eukprot:scaffold157021_cov22-Tisochrysis_lutea.AAC.2
MPGGPWDPSMGPPPAPPTAWQCAMAMGVSLGTVSLGTAGGGHRAEACRGLKSTSMGIPYSTSDGMAGEGDLAGAVALCVLWSWVWICGVVAQAVDKQIILGLRVHACVELDGCYGMSHVVS